MPPTPHQTCCPAALLPSGTRCSPLSWLLSILLKKLLMPFLRIHFCFLLGWISLLKEAVATAREGLLFAGL